MIRHIQGFLLYVPSFCSTILLPQLTTTKRPSFSGAPQASWDVFDRIFYTGVPGFSSFIGVVCLDAVSGIGGSRDQSSLASLFVFYAVSPKKSGHKS